MNNYHIIPKEHGCPLDHIGLAVNNLDAGVKYMRELMGIEPIIHRTDPSTPYRNATFKISRDSFFEIIAPNEKHRGFHPFKSVLRSFNAPTLFFWLIAVDNFTAFTNHAKAYGVRMENVVEVKDVDTSLVSAHIRGQMGPGFFSLRPSVIEWRSAIVELSGAVQCSLKNFCLYDSQPEVLNNLFANLGITIEVQPGDSKMVIELQTPNGSVKLESDAYELNTFKMLKICMKDLLKI